MTFRVTAGFVTVETAIRGGARASIDIPRGAVLPGDVPAEQVEGLLRRGRIERVAEPESAKKAPAKRASRTSK